MSRELRFRAATTCSTKTLRSTVRFMAARIVSRWTASKPEMGQSRTARRTLIPAIQPAALLLLREPRQECSLMSSIEKTILSFFLSFFFTRYAYFVRARKLETALFFSNNGTIFVATEMEIYLITDTWRARYGCGGSDMRFVLSNVDHALMEYYRYTDRILNGRVYRKILCVDHCVEQIFDQKAS